uniref:Ig-like domain-containing protein n=1 Tax=Stegastes partitus TaxID=144197 RepID=A0A3B5AGY4_9TELE
MRLIYALSGVGALQVVIPQPLYEHARGDNITLPCTFTPRADLGPPQMVIISWSVEGTQILILSYYYPTKVTDIKSIYEGRVSIDVDIPSGRANLKLNSITLADNKNFECRVQIPGDDEGRPAANTRLVVLVAPSTPICKIEGKAEYGQNINLTCKSEEGSPPPTYKWESRDVRNMPRVRDPRTTDKGGILSLFNVSMETSGYYTCTSSNKIRSASCNVTLTVMPPSMNIGSTAGIIAGAVAALLILGIIIYCCCCRKKNKEEEYAMGVPEDEYYDKEPDRNGERPPANRQDSDPSYNDSNPKNAGDRRDQYDDRSDYDDRRSDYDDRRSDYDDRRSDYTGRRSDYDDRRDRYSDRNERYDDGGRRYDDERRYDDRRGPRYDDDDRYDEPYDHDDRPPVPSNPKPTRRD